MLKLEGWMRKDVFFLFFIFNGLFAQSPFSSIKITSNSALIEKSKSDKKLIHVSYAGNVRVKLADGSFINSEKLDLLVDSKASGADSKGEKSVPVKKAVFKKNVYAKKQHQQVHADRLELFVQEKKCYLSGNVLIEQTKQKKRDIPLQTKCNEAEVSWDTEEITLLGSAKKPVETIIELNKS